MNAQSNQLEMAFKRNSIPYKIVGGVRFFERAEVKDMLAYLCVIHHPEDDLRLTRIINVPARGIGAKALEALQMTAQQEGVSLWQLLREVERYPHLARSAVRFRSFVTLIEELQSEMETMALPEWYDEMLKRTGYLTMLEEKREENATRIENVKELKSSIVGYLENTNDPSLSAFLDEVALYTDLDSYEDQNNCVGMEEGMFPGFRAIGETEELEEERRLCYVAMTRAKEVLYLSCAAQRMLFGRTSANLPSRFIKEIPEEYVESELRDYKWNNQTPFEDQWQKPSMEHPTTLQQQTPSSGMPKERVSYRAPNLKSAPLPAFSKGDMVEHSAFGRGMLLSVQPMGGDALLEVAFDNVGTKRMMLKAAAQHMTKL
jgi:DNA helicase-2/ATP-dependent DNA helicase PcrA